MHGDNAERQGHIMQGKYEHPKYRDTRHIVNLKWLRETEEAELDHKVEVEFQKLEQPLKFTNDEAARPYSPSYAMNSCKDFINRENNRQVSESRLRLQTLYAIIQDEMPIIIKQLPRMPRTMAQIEYQNLLISLDRMNYEPANRLAHKAAVLYALTHARALLKYGEVQKR